MKKTKQNLFSYIALLALIFTPALIACNDKKPNTNSERELIIADSLFSATSAGKGMKNAFLEYLDSNAVLLRSNRMPIEGITSVKKYFDGFSDSSFILTWKPLKARISSESGMGFTYGIYEILDKTTGHSSEKGTYVTIWQKDEKGNWKAVFDTGNEGIGK